MRYYEYREQAEDLADDIILRYGTDEAEHFAKCVLEIVTKNVARRELEANPAWSKPEGYEERILKKFENGDISQSRAAELLNVSIFDDIFK